jgi:hypothetical protein
MVKNSAGAGVRVAVVSRSKLTGDPLGPGADLDDLLTRLDFTFGNHPAVETGSPVRHQQRSHPALADAHACAITGNTGLGYLEDRLPDPISVPDADLIVRQPFDGQILTQKPGHQVVATQFLGPVTVWIELIHEDGAVLSAVAREVALAVPSMLSRRTIRRPVTGVFQAPVYTVRFFQGMSLGRPTFTDISFATAHSCLSVWLVTDSC